MAAITLPPPLNARCCHPRLLPPPLPSWLCRDVVAFIVLNVLLPFFDVASDLAAGVGLVLRGHPAWGAAVLAFPLLPSLLRLLGTLVLLALPEKYRWVRWNRACSYSNYFPAPCPGQHGRRDRAQRGEK